MDFGRLAIRKTYRNNFMLLRLDPGQETVSGEKQVDTSPSSEAPESRPTPWGLWLPTAPHHTQKSVAALTVRQA